MKSKCKLHWTALAVCSAAALALAGCGGGGGDDHATPPTDSTGNKPTDNAPVTPVTPVTPGAVSAIKGVWFGAGTNGSRSQSARLVVLEDGSMWGVVVSGNDPIGDDFQNVMHGTAQTSGKSVSASYTQFDILSYTPKTGQAFSGSVVDSTHLNLALANGLSVTVQSDPSYATPASLSTLASSYKGPFIIWGDRSYRQTKPTLTIAADGTLGIAADSDGCSVSGTLAPHGTAINVFDLSLTYSGASCLLGNGTTVKGVAALGANKNLEAFASTSDGKYASFFSGVPQ